MSVWGGDVLVADPRDFRGDEDIAAPEPFWLRMGRRPSARVGRVRFELGEAGAELVKERGVGARGLRGVERGAELIRRLGPVESL